MIAVKIFDVRENRGVHLKELAQKCRILPITIRRYEAGDLSPAIDDLEAIARALDCSISDLFDSELK